MRTSPMTTADLCGVFPVPPLCRDNNEKRTINYDETGKIVNHIAAGGIKNFLYGGNAFLYHLTLKEFDGLLDWMTDAADDHLMIPSAGPSFGRAMDQAPLLAKHNFPCVMLLPCGDPREAAGMERGYREFADAAGTPLIVYLKEENNFGNKKEAGLDAVARLVSDGVCVGIKYAVVREDPARDPYLEALLERVDKAYVLSGIGERPAISHMRDFQLPGFTTGSGCIAPSLTRALYEANVAGDWETAESIREQFIGLEDLRDAWGPARVLHAAAGLAGIADSGPIAPYISGLDEGQMERLRPVAAGLAAQAMAAVV